MRRPAAFAAALLTGVVLLAAPVSATTTRQPSTSRATQPAASGRPAAVPAQLSAAGRWIVTLRDGASVSGAALHARTLGVAPDHLFRRAVHGYAARLTTLQVAQLRTDPAVASVVPDELIRVTGQSVPRGVRRIGGMGSVIARLDGIDDRVDADVAIVDTGIDKTHEDLNVVGGISCSTDNPDQWGDPYGHGTHVAGTVGALDNGIGVVGVAPGVRLWSVRILDAAGNGLLSWYVCGLDWLATQRDPIDPTRPLIEVANMSVAKPGTDDGNCGNTNGDVMHQAICRVVDAGVTVVAAAGNNGFNASRMRPASYNEVITVSALFDSDGKPGGLGGNLCFSWGTWDRDDTFADFSNYGPDVDLIAPGKCTWSTLPGNRYGFMSGTSMAAPHVTGAAALYKASRPLATPADVRAALIAAGTQDWKTSTDPDPVHEPLLDVSHIVALGDFTVDATPGTSSSAVVPGAGASIVLPVEVIRAEDFPAEVDLAVDADAPITASLKTATLVGLDGTHTSLTVTVPPGTPSGTYTLAVTGSDGARERHSSFTLTVDGDAPVVRAAVAAYAATPRLGGGALPVRVAWPAPTDATGAVVRQEARWKVDAGAWGAATALGPGAGALTRAMAMGHTFTLAVRARDAAGNWSAWTESPALSPVLVQESSAAVVTAGAWKRSTSSLWSGRTTRYATRAKAKLSFGFTGRGIALIAPTGPGRGRAAIYIDGHYAGSITLNASVLHPRHVVFRRSWATAGAHRITVVVAGTKGHPRVDVDAFAVLR